MMITSTSAIYLADLQYCHSGEYRGMAGLPSFGTVNIGVLSIAIAVAIQQASVSHHSLGQSLPTLVNDSTTHQQASLGSSQAQAQPSSSRSSSDGQECGSG